MPASVIKTGGGRTGRVDDGFARYRAVLPHDSSAATRAEYAAALLAAGRYDQAAAEYRRLLAAEPGNPDYRLGLGRALAWGGHPREAAAELAQSPLPRDSATEHLLHAVRRDVEPSLDNYFHSVSAMVRAVSFVFCPTIGRHAEMPRPVATEATAARAAKTRTCPSWRNNRGATIVPTTYPT